MREIKIIGLSLRINPRPDVNGNTMLAEFDFADDVFTIHDCRLVRTAEGKLHAYLPRRKVRFVNMHDMFDLLEHVKRAFMDMGGDPDLVLHPYRGHDADGWPTHPRHPANAGPSRMDQRLADEAKPKNARDLETLDPMILPPPIVRQIDVTKRTERKDG